jgi:hypothetical protein
VDVLTVMVQSVIRRLANSLCPAWKNLSRTCGCKWSLLKVREGNYKREHGGPSWDLEAEKACFSSPGAFKTFANLWEGRNLVVPNQ